MPLTEHANETHEILVGWKLSTNGGSTHVRSEALRVNPVGIDNNSLAVQALGTQIPLQHIGNYRDSISATQIEGIAGENRNLVAQIAAGVHKLTRVSDRSASSQFTPIIGFYVAQAATTAGGLNGPSAVHRHPGKEVGSEETKNCENGVKTTPEIEWQMLQDHLRRSNRWTAPLRVAEEDPPCPRECRYHLQWEAVKLGAILLAEYIALFRSRPAHSSRRGNQPARIQRLFGNYVYRLESPCCQAGRSSFRVSCSVN